MATSFFEYPKKEDYVLNRFAHKRFENGQTLVTADHGGWALLTQEEFELFRLGRAHEDPGLYNLLKDKGLILSKSNETAVLEDYRRRFCYLGSGVSLHIISPTLRCNHSCIYCHAKSVHMDATGHDMDQDTAKKVVDFIFQTPAKEITIEFQGGEPLANFPVVEYVMDYARSLSSEKGKPASFILVSNLTLMDDDILRYLIKNEVRICTSLDGPKELHEKNRKYLDGTGSYNKVVHWIDVIKNQHAYEISALPTVTRYSLPYATEIVDAYLENGFSRIRARHMINSGFANARWGEIGYTSEEFLDFWKRMLDHCVSLGKKGVKMVEGMSMLISRKFISKDHQSYTCFSSPCGAALGQAAYTPEGNVYACDESRSHDVFRLGNVMENTYKEIYTGRGALTIVDLTSGFGSHCDACVWRPYCGNCLVTVYGAQGGLVSKLPLDRECKIRGGLVEEVFRRLLFSKEDRGYLLKWATRDYGV